MDQEKLSFTDAAEKVLRELSPGRPMHYVDIVQGAIEEGYLHTEGKTPGNTLIALIGTENRKREARGEEPRFVVHGDGYYSLAAPPRGVEREIAAHNLETRKRLKLALVNLGLERFETIITSLLSEIGYEDIAAAGDDFGYDILFKGVLTAGGITSINSSILVLKNEEEVGYETVRELRGILGVHERGVIITPADFTRRAREEAVEADKSPVALVNGDQLVDLLVEHELGVTRQGFFLINIDLEFLEMDLVLPEIEDLEQSPLQVERKKRQDDRVASIWPLPGGADHYADTLFKLLELIIRENPGQDDVATWFLQNYPNVRSRKTTRGYLQVLHGLGLIRYENEKAIVTPVGAELAASHSIPDLRRVLEDELLGIREIYSFLSRNPSTMEQIHTLLVVKLDLQWETTAQTEWRLAWLECVDAIEKDGDMYHLNIET